MVRGIAGDRLEDDTRILAVADWRTHAAIEDIERKRMRGPPGASEELYLASEQIGARENGQRQTLHSRREQTLVRDWKGPAASTRSNSDLVVHEPAGMR